MTEFDCPVTPYGSQDAKIPLLTNLSSAAVPPFGATPALFYLPNLSKLPMGRH